MSAVQSHTDQDPTGVENKVEPKNKNLRHDEKESEEENDNEDEDGDQIQGQDGEYPAPDPEDEDEGGPEDQDEDQGTQADGLLLELLAVVERVEIKVRSARNELLYLKRLWQRLQSNFSRGFHSRKLPLFPVWLLQRPELSPPVIDKLARHLLLGSDFTAQGLTDTSIFTTALGFSSFASLVLFFGAWIVGSRDALRACKTFLLHCKQQQKREEHDREQRRHLQGEQAANHSSISIDEEDECDKGASAPQRLRQSFVAFYLAAADARLQRLKRSPPRLPAALRKHITAFNGTLPARHASLGFKLADIRVVAEDLADLHESKDLGSASSQSPTPHGGRDERQPFGSDSRRAKSSKEPTTVEKHEESFWEEESIELGRDAPQVDARDSNDTFGDETTLAGLTNKQQ